MKTKKKKQQKSSSQDMSKIPQRTSIFGLELHSRSTKPVTFFLEQSLLGGGQLSFEGAQAVNWGARPRNAPRGAGPAHILGLLPEVESSRTSLASRTFSRTHFEVLGLGLEASSPWPWHRSLKSSKIALSSARGQHYFLNG